MWIMHLYIRVLLQCFIMVDFLTALPRQQKMGQHKKPMHGKRMCKNIVHLKLKDNKVWVTFMFLSLEVKGLGSTLIVLIIESLLKFGHSGAKLNLNCHIGKNIFIIYIYKSYFKKSGLF